MNIDLEKLSALFDVLTEKDILEFEHEDEAVKLRVVRGRVSSGPSQVSFSSGPGAVGAPPPGYGGHDAQHAGRASTAPQAPAEIPSDSVDVTSPFVGTFYRSPSPDAPSFVDVGSVVRPGQTLCIVEAMKLMNEIEAEVSGTIVEVFAQNGKAVEFGQKLFRVKKA